MDGRAKSKSNEWDDVKVKKANHGNKQEEEEEEEEEEAKRI